MLEITTFHLRDHLQVHQSSIRVWQGLLLEDNQNNNSNNSNTLTICWKINHTRLKVKVNCKELETIIISMKITSILIKKMSSILVTIFFMKIICKIEGNKSWETKRKVFYWLNCWLLWLDGERREYDWMGNAELEQQQL